ncbi:MAG: glycosyltransferase [Solirubrobacteraceae bacterium]
MIAFAVCIGDPDTFERYGRPGLAAHAEPESPLAEIDTDSIFAGYNEALDAFGDCGDLEALVLLHEDVTIENPAFCAKLRARLADPSIAVVGAIGATGVRSLCWWEGEMRGRVHETRGVIGSGRGCADVEVIDGLLMVLSPWAVRNLRFDDERFHGFHGYDVDLCLQALSAGRRVVVDELDVFHHTRGGIGVGDDFWRADAMLRSKWTELGREMASDAEMAASNRTFTVAQR